MSICLFRSVGELLNKCHAKAEVPNTLTELSKEREWC